MIDNEEYTREELKKAMLNEACPKMKGYYSDLLDDFQQIDKMEIGQTALWFYRESGTSLRVEDSEEFQRDYNFWKHQIFKVFTILRTGKDSFSVMENPKH